MAVLSSPSSEIFILDRVDGLDKGDRPKVLSNVPYLGAERCE